MTETMAAVLLTGHGGLDRLDYRTDVPVPEPAPGQVLIQVAAAGINNTDINTRIGWYSKGVSAGTEQGGAAGFDTAADDDASWSGTPLTFPRIQGADVCGRVVAVGEGVPDSRVGERVLVRNMLRAPVEFRPYECWTFGSECDGGFAQYAVAPAADTYPVTSDLSDAELAVVPCAYSTAEGMLQRAGVGAERTGATAERIVVTGASGGVGLAAVQLAALRGAEVIAVCSESKADAVLAQGATRVIARDADPVGELGAGSVDVVADVVGGPGVGRLLDLLRPGGRYAVSGAIGGPLTEVDLRTIYLKDLTLHGCTFQEDSVFEALISYLRQDLIRPVVAKTYPLSEIAQAQTDFLSKSHVGKLVLLPPEVSPEADA